MFNKDLYNYIMETWNSMEEELSIKVPEGAYTIDIFTEHNVEKKRHIRWCVPITLYQLIEENPDKTQRLLYKYNYETVLFIIAYIYLKYHEDQTIDTLNIWWQWLLIKDGKRCKDERCEVRRFSRLEWKLLKLMDFRIDDYAIADDELYRKYYKTLDYDRRKNILVSVFYSKYFKDNVMKEMIKI